MNNVLVYVQHKNAQTPKVTFEMATQARKLADQLGGNAHALVVGAGSSTLAETLKSYPLDAIHVNDDADVDTYLLDPVIDYLEAAARAIGPSLVLVANTLTGKDVAGRLVARLNAGVCADAVDFNIEGGKIVAVMPKMGGAAITNCEPLVPPPPAARPRPCKPSKSRPARATASSSRKMSKRAPGNSRSRKHPL
jgi:electron transfer flavoprotein alpha subunit